MGGDFGLFLCVSHSQLDLPRMSTAPPNKNGLRSVFRQVAAALDVPETYYAENLNLLLQNSSEPHSVRISSLLASKGIFCISWPNFYQTTNFLA